LRTPSATSSNEAHPRASTCVKEAWVTWVVAVAAIAALAACQPGKAPAAAGPPVASPSASASASPSPTVDPAVVKAVAAYSGYVAEYAHAANSADYGDTNLAKYIGGALLSLSQHNLRVLSEHGAIELGTPTATVQTTSAKLTATPPTVTITACLDYSTYQLVYKSNHKPVPGGALANKRYTTTATVQLFSNGQWLVSADEPHRSTSC
jgi:hypothetical protein